MDRHRVLLIEDDESVAHVIRLELEHSDWDVVVKGDGESGLAAAILGGWDVILLDLMLPGLSGMEVCRRIRSALIDVSIIMLTARHETHDKVTGLDLGADDYITKPFAIEELMARMRVALRHSERGVEDLIVIGDLCLDPAQRRITQNGETINLTRREFDLLHCLLQNANHVLTRDRLIELVWGYDFEGDVGIVDVYVRYLRAKLEQPPNPHIIHTVRGVGFVLREEPK